MWPSNGIEETNGGINIPLVEELTESLGRSSLSYFNNFGAVGLGGSNRQKLQEIMADAQPSDLFHTLSRSVGLQNLGSGDPNKTYPIKAAQLFIATRMQKIGLPSNLQEKPDMIWSLDLPEDVVNILIKNLINN